MTINIVEFYVFIEVTLTYRVRFLVEQNEYSNDNKLSQGISYKICILNSKYF